MSNEDDASECGDVDKVFGDLGPICNEPAGHDGDHIATDRTQTRQGCYPGGTVVSQWENIGAAPPALVVRAR